MDSHRRGRRRPASEQLPAQPALKAVPSQRLFLPCDANALGPHGLLGLVMVGVATLLLTWVVS